MMSDEKLLSCPICDKSVTVALGGIRGTYHYFITRGHSPNGCRCRLFLESEQFSKDASEEDKEKIKNDLIKQWNTRKPVDKMLERLEEYKEQCIPGHHYTPGMKVATEYAIGIVKECGSNV